MNDNQVSAEPEATKICSTCKKPIEVSKFRIHEIGCARNNYICQICGDLVAKAEKEEHEKDAHTKVAC
jgi:DNA-directed RNA polymerase subunit RPC12/RpoP